MGASRSFKIIAIGLLIWNLIGVAAFGMQYGADLAVLAKSDPYTARLFAEMPGWAWAAYAVAVGAGTVGALLLLLRKAAAVALFALSLAAVVVQFGYSFLGTDLWAVKGAGAAVFPAVIVAIAVGQLLYAARLHAKGVLR
ncbi:sugar transporter [Sphingobium agri]|uniref:Sugar transporter n=1 Tax=Sphingobium agri TaxID=2933566 RepID=A0ABT0DVU2_9SPHN|nr:sugar transporter [Sphingobium agri]MCK0531231.1 sugar transporter [Sphingobium agri]